MLKPSSVNISKWYRLIIVRSFIPWLLFFPLTANSISWEDVTLNGYFSFEYEKNIAGDDEDKAGDDLDDRNGSFDLDLIDLVINAQLTDRVRVATDLTWEHGTATEDGRGNSAVEYAFAEYTHTDLLKLRAGKMFTNFSIYNEIHTAKPAYISVKEPLSTNKNNKLGSEIRFYPRWNTGIAALGSGYFGNSAFDYVFQVSNGEVEPESTDAKNPFEEDDNVHKALNGRFQFYPIDQIQLGFSFYDDDMQAGLEDDSEAEIRSYAVHGTWNTASDLYLEVEYIWGSEDITDATTGDETDRDRDAYTFMVAQRFNKYQPYFRWEYLEPDDDVSDDEADLFILGLNYKYTENIQLKIELDYFDIGDMNDDRPGANYTELKASVSIGF